MTIILFLSGVFICISRNPLAAVADLNKENDFDCGAGDLLDDEN